MLRGRVGCLRVARDMALGTALLGGCGGDASAPVGEGTTAGTTGGATTGSETGGAVDACAGVREPGPSPLRRLTHTQYANTVRDLFPGVAMPALTIAVDPAVHGFENNGEAQVPSALLVEQYQRAALAVTQAAMATPSWVPCDGGEDPIACGREFVRAFGGRAFRRPLTEEEAAAFLGFFDQQFAEAGFSVALPLTLQAMLQAPPFLYFLEFGGEPVEGAPGVVALTGYELAARLSYFLWDTTPDATLLAAAGAGELDTAQGVAQAAERMLADPRARGAMVNFHRQWLGFDAIDRIDPDLATYPTYEPGLKASLRGELERLVSWVLFEGPGTFEALLTARTSEVDAGLAGLYGVAAPAEGAWATASLDGAQRAGILTRAGFLAATAHAVHPSPVKRGVFVLSRLLCAPPGPPPPGASTKLPGETGEAPTTNRERYAQHTARAECAACHTTIDGVGFGFEHYDALGRFRELDGGQPVDARGELVGTDVDGEFDGAVALSQRLAESAQARGCVVSQVYRYALGRGTTVDDACGLATLRAEFEDVRGDIRALLRAVVTSDAFRLRRGGAP